MKLGVYHNKLIEKLTKLQQLDEQVLAGMNEGEDFDQETMAQDERTVEMLQVIGNLAAILDGGMIYWE